MKPFMISYRINTQYGFQITDSEKIIHAENKEDALNKFWIGKNKDMWEITGIRELPYDIKNF